MGESDLFGQNCHAFALLIGHFHRRPFRRSTRWLSQATIGLDIRSILEENPQIILRTNNEYGVRFCDHLVERHAADRDAVRMPIAETQREEGRMGKRSPSLLEHCFCMKLPGRDSRCPDSRCSTFRSGRHQRQQHPPTRIPLRQSGLEWKRRSPSSKRTANSDLPRARALLQLTETPTESTARVPDGKFLWNRFQRLISSKTLLACRCTNASRAPYSPA